MLDFPESYVDYAAMRHIAKDVDTFRRYARCAKALAVAVENLETNKSWMEDHFSVGNGEATVSIRSKFDAIIASLSEAGWKDAAYSALRHALKSESLLAMIEDIYGDENYLTGKETVRKLYER